MKKSGNLMGKVNTVSIAALDRVEEQLYCDGSAIVDSFALDALYECVALRNAISRQVRTGISAAISVKADISELRPMFELISGM